MKKSTAHPFRFEGFDNPNYTPVPDNLFDVLAPELSEAELRVLLYIIRRTFGFRKDRDAISLTQMVSGIRTREGRVLDRGTGMSRRGVMNGCAGLVKKGIITVEKRLSDQGDNEINIYRLRFRHEPGVGNDVPHRRHPTAPPVGNNGTPQETAAQKTVIEYSKIDQEGVTARSVAVDRRPLTATQESARTPDVPTSHSLAPESVATVLRRRTLRRAGEGTERDHIQSYLEDISRLFADRAPLRSSVSRAVRLYQRAGVDLNTFIAAMFLARSRTLDRAGSAGAASGGGGEPVRAKMAFWFACLEEALGFRSR